MSARRPSAREEQLERANILLREQLDRMCAEPDDMPDIGCGDNSCIVRHPRGMATNGGCRCDERRLRRAVQYWRRVAEFRQITIMTMRGDLATNTESEHGRKDGA